MTLQLFSVMTRVTYYSHCNDVNREVADLLLELLYHKYSECLQYRNPYWNRHPYFSCTHNNTELQEKALCDPCGRTVTEWCHGWKVFMSR